MDSAAIVKLLVERRCDPERKCRAGETALWFALRHSADHTVEALLRAGASPNSLSQNRENPLRISVQNSRTHSTRVLLEWRADPNVGDEFGETALMEAASQG